METGLYFSVKVGSLPESTFDVVKFTLDEALSELFTLTLTLSSTDPDIDLSGQLLEKVQLTVYSNGQKQRTINGLVASLKRGDSGFKRTFYTLVSKPELWQLTLTKDSRIYHFKSVPAIIDEVLKDFDIVADKQLMDTHTEREYTVCKRESYYEFITRLMAEEGISFWFEEDKLFYSDSRLGTTVGPQLIYNPHPQSGAKEAVITALNYGAQMRPTEVKVKDYRYSHPSVPLDAESKTAKSLPTFLTYDSYGRYQDEALAKQFSHYRLEALQAESETGKAVSNCIQLMPGKLFELSEHPSQSMNNRWQIVRIAHHGTLPQSLDNESDDSAANLTNMFTFIPAKTEWRPLFAHKPLADGDETATVVGPADEEIYVNEDGAVKIHFHWNNYDEANENASCWVRVMQNWNGDGFGFLATPRIGQEVIISYLNGDIDRPIITGTVYNGYNRPPLKLPASKTQTTIKTKTHKGEGFNELRFEDEIGKQEIFIHAQKDMNTKVLNDQKIEVVNNSYLQVKNEHSEIIEGNRYQHQKAEEHHLTESDRKTQIMASDYKTVGNAEHTTIGTIQTTQAGQEIHLKAGSNIIIDGGLTLSLNAGGQHIVLNPAGIWLSSPAKIGGVPMNASFAKSSPTAISGSPASSYVNANQEKEPFRPALYSSLSNDMPANSTKVFAKSCTVDEGCSDAAVEKEPSINFGTMLIYGLASMFSSTAQANDPFLLHYSGSNQENNSYPVYGGMAGSVSAPVIVPTPGARMIRFAPVPIVSYPNPTIKIPTLFDSPKATLFVSSVLLDFAEPGNSYTSLFMGVMIAELFGDDVQYDKQELRDLAQEQGKAKTRVRFFWREDEKTGEMRVYGVHTGEGTPYERVRVRDMAWNPTYKRYEFTELGETKPTIIWTPANPDGKDIPTNTGYPSPENGQFNQPIILTHPIHDFGKESTTEIFPALDEQNFNDYVLVFPADSGIPPIYAYFSKVYEPNKFFENKFPNHLIGSPELVQENKLMKGAGRYNYVVLIDGTLLIGYRSNDVGGGHIDLAQGKPVLAAGEVKIIYGELKYIDNTSGHYEPTGSEAQKAAEKAFTDKGFDVSGKYIEKVWIDDSKLKGNGAWRKK